MNGQGDGARVGTGTGVEVNEGAQDENGGGSGGGAGTGTGVETRRRTPDGNGDGNGDGSEDSSGGGNGDEDNGNGNEDRIGEGEREAKKHKKPQSSCRRHVGNGGNLGGKSKQYRKERVSPVAANPDNLESNEEARGGAQGTKGSSKICTCRKSMCIRLALPLTLSLPSPFAPGTKLMVGVSPRAPWLARAFSRDCTFWDCRGGVLIVNRQPVGPLVSTAAITTATGLNHVDSGRFSSRCCTFWRTHKRRPYSDTLYPTSFNLDSLPAPRICALRKTYGLCFTLGPKACGAFFV